MDPKFDTEARLERIIEVGRVRSALHVTPTGHVVGAVYHSSYWGGTYKVIAPYGEYGVLVECVTPGGGAHQTPGERWSHMTRLDRRDRRLS
ncbi:MAG TPA: hypothetical protein VH541_05730 [Gaiellaceae bacterium]|jgi:hypothetical protein